MKKEYFALLCLTFISVILIRKSKLFQKRITLKKNKRNIIVNNDIAIEYSDLQYYINTRKEFEKRKSMYNKIFDPTVQVVNDLNIDIPEIIDYHIDNQNVHDNYVQKNVKNTYVNVHDFQEDDSSLKNKIIKASNEDHRNDISNILEDIHKRNSYVTNVEAKEFDVIKNIWMNGDDNVKLQVINELLDCVDKSGKLYCPTGVTSRIISAAHVNNPENAPKNKDMLNQEVMAKFGKYYQENEDKRMARQKTVNDYYSVYKPEEIENLIDEWYEHV